ncbi:MAG: TIR domain-containing protein [Rhodanobacter sp.]
MTQASVMPAFRYRAFISYSHRDKSWADWLHKALETYAVPKRLVGQTTAAGVIPRRLAPIFRDRDELASATDLGRKVNEALGQSADLIVICSPHSATSHWVNEEVLAFKRLGRSERIFCLIVDGEPNAKDLPGRAAEECFAEPLRYTVDANGHVTHVPTEPVAADVRPGKDGKTNAKLKLIAGMLDLGFDQLKQRELQRRTKRMTAIAALAMVVMTLTITLAIAALISRHDAVIAQHKAVVAQQAAERRQKQAEGLVGFMLGDLNEKLAQVSRLDIMQSVDDKAMAYFAALPTSDVTDETLEQRAKALEKIGSVRFAQGHLDAALESYRAGANLASTLAHEAPEDSTRQIAYSRMLTFIGMAHWSQGRLDATQQDFESAQQALRVSKSGVKDNLPQVFQVAMLDNDIGHVLEARGQPEAAEAAYRNAMVLSQKLVAAKPDNTDFLLQLGIAHNNLGKMALMRGDLATAIAEYRADDAIESNLSARDPKNNDQLANTFTVRAILGRTLALAGEVDAGMRDLQQAIDIATRLSTLDPSQTQIQENLALYQMQLGRLLRLGNQLPKAVVLTERALQGFATLTKQDPGNAEWKRELAEVQTEHAAQTLSGGDKMEAQKQAQTALDMLESQFAKQPDNHALLLVTTNAKLLLADVIGNAPSAQRLRKEALIMAQAPRGSPGDPRLLALQVKALLALGKTTEATTVIRNLWKAGYRDPALLSVLHRADVDYPVNALFAKRIAQPTQVDTTHLARPTTAAQTVDTR